jgi:hypothetical protein
VEPKNMLRSYKAIADRIKKVWGTDVSVPSVVRWSKALEDPLPLKRIKPTASSKRSLVVADASAIERWALRRIA